MRNSEEDLKLYTVGYLPQKCFSLYPQSEEVEIIDDFDSAGETWSEHNSVGYLSPGESDESTHQDPYTEEIIRESSDSTLNSFKSLRGLGRVFKLRGHKMEHTLPIEENTEVTPSDIGTLNTAPDNTPVLEDGEVISSVTDTMTGSAGLLNEINEKAQKSTMVNPVLQGVESVELPTLFMERHPEVLETINETSSQGSQALSNKIKSQIKNATKIKFRKTKPLSISPQRLRSGTVLVGKSLRVPKKDGINKSQRKPESNVARAGKHKAETPEPEQSNKKPKEDKNQGQTGNEENLTKYGFDILEVMKMGNSNQDRSELDSDDFDLENREDTAPIEQTGPEQELDMSLDNDMLLESFNQLSKFKKDSKENYYDCEYNTITVDAMIHRSAENPPLRDSEEFDLERLLKKHKDDIENTMLSIVEQYRQEINQFITREISNAKKEILSEVQIMITSQDHQVQIQREVEPLNTKIHKLNQEVQRSIGEIERKIANLKVGVLDTSSKKSQAAKGTPNLPLSNRPIEPRMQPNSKKPSPGVSSLAKLKRVSGAPSSVIREDIKVGTLIDINHSPTPQQELPPALLPKQKDLQKIEDILDGITSSIFLEDPNLDTRDLIDELMKRVRSHHVAKDFAALDRGTRTKLAAKEAARYISLVKNKKL